VITHNRGTINSADALFGVSMGENGVSQVISLKLDEDIETEEDVA
jgi:chromosome segregation protein